MEEKEQWRRVPGMNRCIVSSAGRIAKLTGGNRKGRPLKKRVLRPHDANGTYYPRTNIAESNRTEAVHSLIAAAFLGPRPDGYQINHKNGIKNDNRACNLEYVTPSQNMQHALGLGLKPTLRYSQEKMDEIKSLRVGPPGLSYTKIAEAIGCASSTIKELCLEFGWKRGKLTECSATGCTKKPRSAYASLCEMHYGRLRDRKKAA